MKASKKLVLGTALIGLCAVSVMAADQNVAVERWAPVTSERLLHPDDGSWLGYRRSYDATGFSPLKQINTDTVPQLRAVWSYSVPDNSRWAPEPIVANGIMYVAETDGRLIAYDATNGDVLWIHQHRLPKDVGASEAVDRARGVAVYDNMVYWGTADSELMALDAKTGKLVWETSTGDYHTGEGHNHAPLIAEGTVFIGMAGGDRGARGRLTAVDAKTGKLLWTFYTVPRKGDPGYESWGNRDQMPPMGGAPWSTISYDPDLHLIFFGTGQPTPWTTAIRGAGDALYSDSMIALDTRTGKMRWHYQMIPGDNWDRSVYEGMLVELDIQGRRRKVLIATSKIGWGVVLDRATGKFISAFKTAYDNYILGWSPQGRPKMNPELQPRPEDVGSGRIFEVCPHWHGARNLQAPSFSKDTGLYYLGVNNSCMDARVMPVDLHNALPSMIGRPGYDVRAMAGVVATAKFAPGYDHVGEFVALDPATGRRAWIYKAPGGVAMTASALATAGGIVFGGTADRQFFALDAKTGLLLWQTRLSGDISGSPTTFQVNDRQYVAVAAGGKPAPSTSYAPLTDTDLSRGTGTITVFALPDPRDTASRPAPPRVLRQSSEGPNKPIPAPPFFGSLPETHPGGTNANQPAGRATSKAESATEPRPDRTQPSVPAPGPAGYGLFTSQQAAHGEEVFHNSCSSCHNIRDQTGQSFRAKWAGSPLGPLYDIISSTMPMSSPGSLSPEDYASVLAYWLKASGYPQGSKALPADSAALTKIKVPR